MGRIIGLIGCTCLVIAALRLTNLSHVDSPTLKGGVDRTGTQEKLSPRDHFRRGKENFMRGRYAAALPLLEEAVSAKSGLSAIERKQAENYLSRSRSKVQAAVTGGQSTNKTPQQSTVRGQSDRFDDLHCAPFGHLVLTWRVDKFRNHSRVCKERL